MISVRITLLVFFFLSIPAGHGIATEGIISIKSQKQTEPCVEKVSKNYSYGKGLLEDFHINTDGFENLPQDVKCFLESASLCQYYAGESPYDAERQKEIIEGLKKYCTIAQNEMNTLKIKYKNQNDIQEILAVCDREHPYSTVCTTFDPNDYK